MLRKVLLMCIILSGLAFAETNGTLNFSVANNSITTGLFGYTVSFCSANTDCFQYKCFLDFDGKSEGSSAGWCNETSVTNCYANVSSTSGTSKVYTTGSKVCDSSTSYRTCSSGAWGSSTSCSSNQTCSSGTCASAATSSSSGGGGSGSSSSNTTANTTKTPAISIIFIPETFNITQGNTTTKNIMVKNTGDLKLSNITLTITGLDDWVTIVPENVSVLDKNITQTFIVAIKIPSKADVNIYKATATVATNYSAAADTESFFINVLPSEETIENDIVPRFNEYSSQLEKYKNNLTEFEKQGIDTGKIAALVNNAEDRLSKADMEIQAGNYFAAKILLDEAESLLNATAVEILEAKKPLNLLLIIIAVVVIGVAALVGYMLYPSKPKEERSLKFKA
ncbi:MAG: hypothetical protein HY513_05025 [Candidatus Aenigmarchaeota archaeon]|nr:hypothetical protein [Candidatus Aenigmarchaeota archaeon]